MRILRKMIAVLLVLAVALSSAALAETYYSVFKLTGLYNL